MKIGLIYLSWVLLCGSASARMWTDRDGTLIEGDYVRMGTSQVVVRDRAGKARNVPLKRLSSLDIEYLTSVFVPDLTVVFSKSSRKKWQSSLSSGDKIDIVTGRVKIQVKQKIPNDTLRAEAYLIGAEVATPDFRIMSKVSSPLKFTAENDFTASLQLEMESREYEEYNKTTRGTLYDGYLVVVFDQKNNRIDFKTNISWLDEETIPLLMKFRVNAFFNDDCKSRSVPRPEYTVDRAGTW